MKIGNIPFIQKMRISLLISLTLLIFGCKNGCKNGTSSQTDQQKDSALAAHADSVELANAVNPLLVDSIKPPSLRDTVKLTDYGKDSLRMVVAFQLAANHMSRALKEKNALQFARFAPPVQVQKSGGENNYLQMLLRAFKEDQGVVSKVVAGPIKRVAAALDDSGYVHGWYCLIPVRRFVSYGNGDMEVEMQWFGGQTLNDGKKCYFLNVTKIEREKILSLIPDLRFVLDPEASNFDPSAAEPSPEQ
jgi:hypothetical protein